MFSRIWRDATTLLQAPQRIGGAFFRLEGSRRAISVGAARVGCLPPPCASSSAIPALLWRAPWRVSPCARLTAQGAGPDSLRTLSNVKGNRSAPSLSARVTCPHSSQTNRSEPTMCVSAIPWAQSCKCRCAVTIPQPKHSFVTICFLITRQSRTQRHGPLRTRRHRWESSRGDSTSTYDAC